VSSAFADPKWLSGDPFVILPSPDQFLIVE
jgi:hypothetical protein